MPFKEFQRQASGRFSLAGVEKLASYFGTSFEATVYRLATAHPGLAVAGMLQYRLTRDEERSLAATTNQTVLFPSFQRCNHSLRSGSIAGSPCISRRLVGGRVYDPFQQILRSQFGCLQSAIWRHPEQRGKPPQLGECEWTDRGDTLPLPKSQCGRGFWRCILLLGADRQPHLTFLDLCLHLTQQSSGTKTPQLTPTKRLYCPSRRKLSLTWNLKAPAGNWRNGLGLRACHLILKELGVSSHRF